MTSTQHKRGPRGDITVDLLLEAAERVLSEVGLFGLSLRAVAREAQVSPNALYTYFSDMGDLKNQLGDALYGRIDPTVLQSGTPREALTTFVTDTINVFHASQGHVELLVKQRTAGPNVFAVHEAVLSFFTERVSHTDEQAVASLTLLIEWLAGKLLLAPQYPMSPVFVKASSELDLDLFPRTVGMLAADPPNMVDEIVTATLGCA